EQDGCCSGDRVGRGLPLHRQDRAACPRDDGAGAGRHLLRGRPQQHDSRLGYVAGSGAASRSTRRTLGRRHTSAFGTATTAAATIRAVRNPTTDAIGPATASPTGLITSEISQSHELTRDNTSSGMRAWTTDHHSVFSSASPKDEPKSATAIGHVPVGFASNSNGTPPSTRPMLPTISGRAGFHRSTRIDPSTYPSPLAPEI